jgi:putative copper export protein
VKSLAAGLERGAAVVAVVALSIWVGGLVALGACAAPIVFKVVPAPLSGDAMGAVFRRFDGLAIGAAVVVLGCEAVRMWVREGPATRTERLRAALVVVAAALAIYGGVKLSPSIVALHASGAVRGFGEGGRELEALHEQAEGVAKAEVFMGLLLLGLQITTLRSLNTPTDPPKPARPNTSASEKTA